ncbi:uncharacterized protein LOC131594488 [Vicia villosa]|uniref:uncharacterized protein LOC131594488 n=1 Tax=Vicia villosa TaxID=3911 RepID=UPI00273BF785|nr:uncharacterized protein LOC131594488 [Vicia villosa]
MEAWDMVVKQMRRKLALWKGRNLSIGKRVTLVNSILCNMPIYSFSFYRTQVKVIQTIRRIQRQFIWQGSEEKVGINWVSWKAMSKEKCQGGLRLKDMGAFNEALLGKWKWRVLNDDEALWSNLLRVRYGNLQLSWLRKKDMRLRNKESLWCRDLGMVGKRRGSKQDAFNDQISFKIGDGKNTSFCKARWLGNGTLANQYHTLFNNEGIEDSLIAEYGWWEGGTWH